MADPKANEKLVLDYLEAMRVGDHPAAKAAFHADATWDTPPSMPWKSHFEGVDAIFGEYFAVDEDLFETGTSSYDLTTTCVIAGGDHVVVEMDHKAVGLNGKPYDTAHCLVFELRDGRIQAVREYVDSLYLKTQMMS